MKLHRKLSILGASLILLGLIDLIPLSFLTGEENQIDHVSAIAPTKQTDTEDFKSGKPNHIVIASLGIDLPINNGLFDETTEEWTLGKTSAYFALPSDEPNSQAGNTLIYGHNIEQVFANLHDIKTDTIVNISTENGHTFSYTFKSSEIVSPKDTSVLYYQGKPRLTLLTCDGVNSENRKLFYFDLISIL